MNLEEVYLHGNKLESLPSCIFDELEKLVIVNLEANYDFDNLRQLMKEKSKKELHSLIKFESKHQLFIDILGDEEKKNQRLDKLDPYLLDEFLYLVSLTGSHEKMFEFLRNFKKNKTEKIKEFGIEEFQKDINLEIKEIKESTNIFQFYEGRSNVNELINLLHELETLK